MRNDERKRIEEGLGSYSSDVAPRGGLTRMSELPDWEVTEGTDIRGWSVVDRDRDEIGKVKDLLVDAEGGIVEYAMVTHGTKMRSDWDRTLIPMDELQLDKEKHAVIVDKGYDELKSAPAYDDNTTDYQQYRNYWSGKGERSHPKHREGERAEAAPHMKHEHRETEEHEKHERREKEEYGKREPAEKEEHRMVIPEVEEHLETEKRTERIGEVEVRRKVEEHPETVHETLQRTRVRVSRRPVEGGREAREGEPVLREGESMTIPIVEERLVVEKRPEVTGEVVIEPETVETEAKKTESVRKESVEVEKHGDVDVEEKQRKTA